MRTLAEASATLLHLVEGHGLPLRAIIARISGLSVLSKLRSLDNILLISFLYAAAAARFGMRLLAKW